MGPYATLAEQLGSLAVQLQPSGRTQQVRVQTQGSLAEGETRALAVSALSGVLRVTSQSQVTLVNATKLADSRGITLVEEKARQSRNYQNLLTVTVETDTGSRSVSGTCFDDRMPRIVGIDGLEIDLKPSAYILFIRYADEPGKVGTFGTLLGEARINIAGMEVGRTAKGEDAIVALTLDHPVPDEVRERVRKEVEAKEIYVVSL
jgi:D-3-phosphoglycerate dehydrogenase